MEVDHLDTVLVDRVVRHPYLKVVVVAVAVAGVVVVEIEEQSLLEVDQIDLAWQAQDAFDQMLGAMVVVLDLDNPGSWEVDLQGKTDDHVRS